MCAVVKPSEDFISLSLSECVKRATELIGNKEGSKQDKSERVDQYDNL